jgi:CubicO group peptidase (beta-lactamase class C family)
MILAALLLASRFDAAFPAIDKAFTTAVEKAKVPGAVVGIVDNGQLVYVRVAGIRDAATNAPVSEDTRFRIASMTKGFTAMAILKLRDAGKLQLDDPVSKYIPELAKLEYPTKDSPVITVRHLLSHSEGFPEDNPWGDRQLAQTNETLSAWMKAGIPFSNAPGVAYEYSNYGFGILGQIVERVSGVPYKDYVRDQIFKPLGMMSTTFDVEAVPRDRIAYGYRWENDKLVLQPPLKHGVFGAMGGIWTTAADLSKYVGFLAGAFPPRDDPETGPIRRASAREMQQAWRFASAGTSGGKLNVASYGFGLRINTDCRFNYMVGHGGGLPGYGSYESWLPDYGVGVITFANLTYTSLRGLHDEIYDALLATGKLQKRSAQPAPALLAAKDAISSLIVKWDQQLADRIAADNLFLDQSPEVRKAQFADIASKQGACRADPGIDAENALRGQWRMTCDRGALIVATTLAPTMPPKVQFVSVTPVMSAADEPPPRTNCRP